MEARLQKWGNSIGIRIPHSIVKELNLKINDWINIEKVDDRVVMTKQVNPKISLANASELFKLNDMEKDIILKHMWPLTVIPPKYTEGIIVTLVDKYSATRGFFGGLRYLRKTKLLSEKNQAINERK